MTNAAKVYAIPCERNALAASHLVWDAEALVLDVTFSYPAQHERPNLAQEIEARLGLAAPEARLTLGDVDISLDPVRRPTVLSVRAGISAWVRSTDGLDIQTANAAPPSHLHFAAALDENALAHSDLTVRLTRRHDTLHLWFGNQSLIRWVRLSDTLCAGIGAEHALGVVALEGGAGALG